MTEPLPALRDCDGCTLCCKIFGIPTLGKPPGAWCPHCRIGSGCGIYEDRPPECRAFQCGYLVEPGLDERWKPSEAKFFLSSEPGVGRLAIRVDPQRPDAWKREPFYSSIKQWAKEALEVGSQVAVFIGERVVMILPDRDVDLGICTTNDLTITTKTRTAAGIRYEAFKLDKNDPRAAELKPANFSMAAASAPQLGTHSRKHSS